MNDYDRIRLALESLVHHEQAAYWRAKQNGEGAYKCHELQQAEMALDATPISTICASQIESVGLDVEQHRKNWYDGSC